MTPGAFVDELAEVLGLPRASVAVVDRVLAKAGLRSVGGRGPSAVHLTSKDGATILIATIGSPIVMHAGDVARRWQRVVSLGLPKRLPAPFGRFCALGQAVPLPLVVQHLIELPPETWRQFHGVLELGVDQHIATLRVTRNAKKAFSFSFAKIADASAPPGKRPAHGDLTRLALITSDTFEALHRALLIPPTGKKPPQSKNARSRG